MTRYRICRPVVYDDDLEILKALIQNTLNCLIEVSTQVVAGYDNRNRRTSCSHPHLLSMHSAFTAIKLLLNVACRCRDSLLSTSCLSLAFIPYCNMGVGSLLLQNDIKAPFCSLMIHVIYSVGHIRWQTRPRSEP